jgi:hypothetical protein
MTTYPWKVEVRNSAFELVGELDDYQQLDLRLKFNDVSTWQLTVNRRNRLAQDLVADGAGIVVTRNGTTILSGPWTNEQHTKNDSTDQLVLSGVDDTIWVKRRLAHPQPGTAAPPYSTSAEEVWTGAASSVILLYARRNLGPDALVTRDRVEAGADAGYGLTVTGRARWQNLLTLCQELAVAGAFNDIPLGFRVVQVGSALEFQEYVPVDRTAEAVFSEGSGNLASFTYERSAPEGNYWFVGGPGEGNTRTIYEQPDSESIAAWGRIEGEFVDARSAATAAELAQAATKASTDHGVKTSLSVTPIDTDILAFGVHYGLGDRVTAVLDVLGPDAEGQIGDAVQDVLRECRIQLTPDSSTVTPSVGGEGSSVSPLRLFRQVRDMATQLINLKRR